MSTFIVPIADNLVAPVVRGAANLPTTGTSTVNLFTVTGGDILLKGLVMEVTTAITSGTSIGTITVRPKNTPTVGSVTNLSAVSTALVAAASPIGSLLSITGDVTAAPALNVLTQGAISLATTPLVIRPGTIGAVFTVAVENLTAGAVKWYLVYELIDSAAVVVAV